jgi:hypothetical protein
VETVNEQADTLGDQCIACLYLVSRPRSCYPSLPKTSHCPVFVKGFAFLDNE